MRANSGLLRPYRRHKRRGADLIKIMPSGGIASTGDNPRAQLMTDDEMRAAVETAHGLGLKVAAHLYPADAIEHEHRQDEVFGCQPVLANERTRGGITAQPARPTGRVGGWGGQRALLNELLTSDWDAKKCNRKDLDLLLKSLLNDSREAVVPCFSSLSRCLA